MNYLIFKITNYHSGYYIWSNQYSFEPHYLQSLVSIFNDGGCSLHRDILRQLITGEGKGIGGNSVSVSIKNNDVLIGSIFDEESNEYTVHIDRFVLIDIIKKWETIRNLKIREIAFIQYDDGTIDIRNRIDCPELYEIDIDGSLLNVSQQRFVLFSQFKKGMYCVQRDNCPSLSSLADLFYLNGGWLEDLKKYLMFGQNRSIISEQSYITILDKNVIIEPACINNSKDYQITLPIDQLISIIEQWQKLNSGDSKYIIFIRHSDGYIEVKDFSNSTYKLWYF